MCVRLAISIRYIAIGMIVLSLSSCATPAHSAKEEQNSHMGISQDQALALARKHVLDSGLGSKVFISGFVMGPKVEWLNIAACQDCWAVTFTPKNFFSFPSVYIVLIDGKTGEIQKAVWEE